MVAWKWTLVLSRVSRSWRSSWRYSPKWLPVAPVGYTAAVFAATGVLGKWRSTVMLVLRWWGSASSNPHSVIRCLGSSDHTSCRWMTWTPNIDFILSLTTKVYFENINFFFFYFRTFENFRFSNFVRAPICSSCYLDATYFNALKKQLIVVRDYYSFITSN